MTNTKLEQVRKYLQDMDIEALEALLTTIDADTGVINSKSTAIEADTDAMNARQAAQVDAATGAHTIIDSDHRYIHEGKKFSTVLEQALAQDEIYKLSFISPSAESGKYVHWRPALISSSGSLLIVRLYENVTSAGGSAIIPVNANRISQTIALTTVKKGVTADVSGATPIAIFSVGSGGTPQSRAGGSVSAGEEIVLKQGTEYIMEIEEPNVAATNVYVQMKWYEEEN